MLYLSHLLPFLTGSETDGIDVFVNFLKQIEGFVDAEVQLDCPNHSSSIDALIILVPIGIFVLPPLLFSVLVLVLWKKGFQESSDTSTQEERNTYQMRNTYQVPRTQKKFSDFYDVDEAGDSFLTDI